MALAVYHISKRRDSTEQRMPRQRRGKRRRMDTAWYLTKVSDMIGLWNVRGIDHTSVTPGAGAPGDQTGIAIRRRGMNDLIGTGTMVGLTKGIATRSATGGGRSRPTSPLRNLSRGIQIDRRSRWSLVVDNSLGDGIVQLGPCSIDFRGSHQLEILLLLPRLFT